MAVVNPVFLDSGVLVAGFVDFGAGSEAPQKILDAVADGRVREVQTAWHSCLEFYAVTTRLPEEWRLTPADARHLLEQEILPRMRIHQIPEKGRHGFLLQADRDLIQGGRIYDAHIAEIARLAGAAIVVTDNRRHFTSLLRQETRVLGTAEFVAEHRL